MVNWTDPCQNHSSSSSIDQNDKTEKYKLSDIPLKDAIIVIFMLGLWLYSIIMIMRAWSKIHNIPGTTTEQQSNIGGNMWRFVLEYIQKKKRMTNVDKEKKNETVTLNENSFKKEIDMTSDMELTSSKSIDRNQHPVYQVVELHCQNSSLSSTPSNLWQDPGEISVNPECIRFDESTSSSPVLPSFAATSDTIVLKPYETLISKTGKNFIISFKTVLIMVDNYKTEID